MRMDSRKGKNPYLRCLMGKVGYAIHINPSDKKMIDYFKAIQTLQKGEDIKHYIMDV